MNRLLYREQSSILNLQLARQTQGSTLFSDNSYYKLGSLAILSHELQDSTSKNWKQEYYQLIAEAEVILAKFRNF